MNNQLIPHTEDQRLTLLNNGLRAIEEANTLEDVKQIRDQSAALINYAKQQRASLAAQNAAAEIKIRAERKAGELLRAMPKATNHHKKATTTSTVAVDTPTLSEVGISHNQSSRWQKSAEIPQEVFDQHIEDTVRVGEELTSAGVQRLAKGKPHVSHNTGFNEWYTPSKYIESARLVMGSIDCDPASSEIANQTVKANTYYTVNDNGLTQEWAGKVWMNPPYSKELIGKFADKLIGEWENGNIVEAIVLVNNATETRWFQSLLVHTMAICFPSSRVKFVDTQGNPSGSPLQGQAFLYIGWGYKEFCREFNQHGYSFSLDWHSTND